MTLHRQRRGHQRARELGVQDQEIGDLGGRHVAAIGPVKGAVRRHGAQKRGPLVIVELRPDEIHPWQQDVIFHVDQPRGVVGPFQPVTEAKEIVAVIAQMRGFDGATQKRRLPHRPVGQAAQLKLAARLAFKLPQLLKGRIQRVPHLAGQRGPHDAPVFPRAFKAGGDRGRVVAVEKQIAFDVALHRVAVFVAEPVGGAGGPQERIPFVAIAMPDGRQKRDPRPHLQKPGHHLRPLDIAADPVEVVGGPAQHVIYSASTQVSLTPPPCEELTTSEPSRSATRVRPPGTSSIFSPTRQ